MPSSICLRTTFVPTARLYKRDVLAVLMAVLMSFPFSAVLSPAVAQTSEVVTGAALGLLLDKLEDSFRGLIAQAGSQARYTTLVAAQQGLLLVDSMRIAMKDIIGDANKTLNDQQKQAYDRAQAALASADGLAKGKLEQAKNIVSQVNEAIADVPFAKSTPRVTGYTNTYIAQNLSQHIDKIELGVSGNLLDAKTPTLKITNAVYAPAESTSRHLKFLIDRQNLAFDSKITQTTGEVTVYEDRRHFFNLFGDVAPKTYRFLLYLVPDVMGTYSVVADVSTTNREWKLNSRRPVGDGLFRTASGYGSAVEKECHGFGPEPGWKIDTSTLHWLPGYENHGSFWGFENSDLNKGFVCLGARPFTTGGAISRWIGRLARQNIGVIQGYVTFNEYRDVETTVNTAVGSGQLSWGQDIPIKLPPGSRGFQLTVATIDGKRAVIDGVKDERWYDVNWSPNDGRVIISPKEVGAALGG